MGNALRMGLAGGLMGAMQGMHQKVQEEEYQLRTERALAAKAAMEERILAIKAEYDNAKGEQEHGRAKELKGMELDAADSRARETQAAADKRTSETNASRERAAAIRASAPRGEGTKPKQQLFTDDNGKQMWIAPGDDIPEGFYRAPTSGKPKSSKPATTAPSAPAQDENAMILERARKAIEQGASREAVIARMRQSGLDALAGKL